MVTMSAGSDAYADLHRLIDRLTLTQVKALHAVALEFIRTAHPAQEAAARAGG
ncbi:hypothetical protein [Sphaerisporangium rufum]|uniref:hypothetical protein n=1 Tax=Sphaerisporangium rufum TaxID=1381558 RepID=UPI00194DC6D2|nr:hypothetical protein [Sphaerisporangium rufum]